MRQAAVEPDITHLIAKRAQPTVAAGLHDLLNRCVLIRRRHHRHEPEPYASINMRRLTPEKVGRMTVVMYTLLRNSPLYPRLPSDNPVLFLLKTLKL